MSKSRSIQSDDWHPTKEHLINTKFFKEGLLVIKPKLDSIRYHELADEHHFTVKSKNFILQSANKIDPEGNKAEPYTFNKDTTVAVNKVTNLLLAITHPQIFQIPSLFQKLLKMEKPEEQPEIEQKIIKALGVLKTILPLKYVNHLSQIDAIKTQLTTLPALIPPAEKTDNKEAQKEKKKKRITRYKTILALEKNTNNLINEIIHLHAKEGNILRNRHRRGEIFRPIILNDNQNSFGMYVSPGLLNSDADFQFTGFDQFVTAGCFYGSSIKGRDQLGHTFLLIKHDQKFHDGQKIETIQYDIETLNPYEEMLFAELEKLAIFINTFSTANGKKLNYHLPYYDYMLFGVDLFLSKRITLDALNSLFTSILSKKEEMSRDILEIFQTTHGIQTIIESPFDNLFGNIHLPLVFQNKLSEDPEKLAQETATRIIDLVENKETLRQALEKTSKEDELDEYEISDSLIDSTLSILNTFPKNPLTEEARAALVASAKQELTDEQRTKVLTNMQDKNYNAEGLRLLNLSQKATEAKIKLKQADSTKMAKATLIKLEHSQLVKLIKATITKQIKNALAEYILRTLNLSCNENELVESSLAENRKALVLRCIDKLRHNTYNITHRDVWKDFLTTTDLNTINNFEDLFKIANAMMIGVASTKGKKLCTLFPDTEKQIILTYNDYVKKLDSSVAKHFNFTYANDAFHLLRLESLIVYSAQNRGLPFYSDQHPTELADLINTNNLLHIASENLAQRTKPDPDKQIKELSDILPKVLPPSCYRKPRLNQRAAPNKLKSSNNVISHFSLFSKKAEPHGSTSTLEPSPRHDI